MPQNFFISSVGKKIVMAVTGVIMLTFVTAHLIGNLLVFAGAEQFNSYANFLQNLGPLLWALRAFMLLVVTVHVCTAVWLTKENFAARPDGYICRKNIKSGFASNYMGVLGSLLATFLVFHILHFTVNVLIYPEHSMLMTPEGYRDVYSMVLLNFKIPWISAFYIFMMAVLCLHMWHCIQSFFQTLGVRHVYLTPIFEYGGKILAVIISLGFMSIPVSVQAGLLVGQL